MNDTRAILRVLGACQPTIDWARDHPDPKEAYNACPNLEWLFWILVECGIQRDRLLPAELALAHTAASVFSPQTAARYVYDRLLWLAEHPKDTEEAETFLVIVYREYINARRGSLQEAAWAIVRDSFYAARNKSWVSRLAVYNGSTYNQSDLIPPIWLDTVRERIPFSVVFGAYNDHK